METLVEIYDKDYLKNCVSSLIFDVNDVFFVYQKKDINGFDNLKKVLKRKKPKLNINFIEYNYEALDQLLNYEDIMVDIYGGEDYLQLKIYEWCLKNNILSIMVNSVEQTIVKLNCCEHLKLEYKKPQLSIHDLLELSGGEIVKSIHQAPNENDINYQQALNNIFNIVVSTSFKEYSEMCAIIMKNAISDNLIIGDNAIKIRRYRNTKDLFSLRIFKIFLEKKLFKVKDEILYFKSKEIFILIKNAGLLLEQYLYINLKNSNYFDEVKMSVVIKKEYKNHNHTNREIDLVLLKDLKLIFISCKMYGVNIQDIMEIKTHEKYFGNFLSSAGIVCGQWIEKRNPNLYLRTKELDVFIIDNDELKNRNAIEDIISVSKDKYHYDL